MNPSSLDLEKCRAEQSAAAAYLAEHPGDRGAEQWRDDWLCEECLILLEEDANG